MTPAYIDHGEERPVHDFNRCHCDQWGRCLVHCPTCHCGEAGRHVYVGNDRFRWEPSGNDMTHHGDPEPDDVNALFDWSQGHRP